MEHKYSNTEVSKCLYISLKNTLFFITYMLYGIPIQQSPVKYSTVELFQQALSVNVSRFGLWLAFGCAANKSGVSF